MEKAKTRKIKKWDECLDAVWKGSTWDGREIKLYSHPGNPGGNRTDQGENGRSRNQKHDSLPDTHGDSRVRIGNGSL